MARTPWNERTNEQDPEQGIEDEYHKKHDAQYCWRATRLIMVNRSNWLEDSSKSSAAEGKGNTALLIKAATRLVEEGKAAAAGGEGESAEAEMQEG